MTTRQEQILVHLYGYLGTGNEYQMPFGTNQDGIAEAIGIRRAQVAIELQKLERKNLIHYERKHSYREDHPIRQLRRCYFLEPAGIRKAQELIKMKEAA